MKMIDIEWRHLQVEGETCERCGDTGALLRELVANLNRECEPRGVRVLLTEAPLGLEAIEQSNQVLIDGHPLEARVPNVSVGVSRCDSCGEFDRARVSLAGPWSWAASPLRCHPLSGFAARSADPARQRWTPC